MPRSGLYVRIPRGTVLFVERDIDLRCAYQDVCELLCLVAYVAATVDEGLALARTLRPDVVLCDVPHGAAFGLASSLRTAAPGACLVAVTSEWRPERRARECAGFDWTLQKVFGLDECETTLIRAIEAARARRRAV